MDIRSLSRALTLLGLGTLILSGCAGGNSSITDVTAPTVVSTEPNGNDTGVVLNKNVIAVFSEPMLTDTINTSTFTVTGPNGAVNGVVTLLSDTATFDPTVNLDPNAAYTATVTTGAQDMSSNRLAANKTWTFSTGIAAGDTTPPTVISTDPAANATNVSRNQNVTATFSEPMNAGTINAASFTLKLQGGTLIPATVSYTGNTATLDPNATLAANTLYVAAVSTAAKDSAGNAMTIAKTWSFTTASAAGDTTPPTVISTDPAANATSVSRSQNVSATFSEPMNAGTINSASFTLKLQGGTLVPATVSYTGNTATLDPNATLAANTLYVAAVSTAAKDSAGNAMTIAKTWSFTTASVGDVTPPTVISTNPTANATNVVRTQDITATFSESMSAATINSNSFTLRAQGGAAVAATISYSGNVATLDPTPALNADTLYDASISTAVKDSAGNSMTTAKTWSFRTAAAGDITAPTVTSTDPAANATNVVRNRNITATFSEAMNPQTINASSFTLKLQGGTLVPATVSYAGNVATLDPSATLAANTLYIAAVSTAAKDTAGNAMTVAKTWSFTTASADDTTRPTVTSTNPVANAVNVSTTQNVSATFSEAMTASTITPATFTLKAGTVAVPASVSYANNIAVLNPTSSLAANTLYTATVSSAVRDAAGNSMASHKIWSFTTAKADGTAPTVVSTFPLNNATNVFRNTTIRATFSEPMQASTLNALTFKVSGSAGTVSYDPATRVATFTPSADLAPNTLFTARIETGAKDLAGNGLAVAKVWSFTTGVQRSQQNINLGAASTFAVLAGSTVTNGGPSVITGDLGVSPGTSVTGFPPGIINGALHAGDSAAAQAKTALLAAQLDAAGRLGGATLPGNLSGLTFTPGLYKNSTSVMLTTGNVTLDAQGDVNAVFIFQMGSTLTTSTGTNVILSGGAQAKNIYWSVGSSATLGVNSTFKGIILAEVSISVNTGAVVDGTLLTKIGAVTLQSNRVTK